MACSLALSLSLSLSFAQSLSLFCSISLAFWLPSPLESFLLTLSPSLSSLISSIASNVHARHVPAAHHHSKPLRPISNLTAATSRREPPAAVVTRSVTPPHTRPEQQAPPPSSPMTSWRKPPAAVATGSSTALPADPAPDAPTPTPASTMIFSQPARPGFGKSGERDVVRANHFLVNVADKELCHYNVSITPKVTSKGLCGVIMKQLVDMYSNSDLKKKNPVYDGRNCLYTAGDLPFESKDFVIKLPPMDGSSRAEKNYSVTIKFAGKADPLHLKQSLMDWQIDVPQSTIQILNIVMRESPPRNNYHTVGRSFFSRKFSNIDEIGNDLECWRGYRQSIRPTQMGLSLNIDISATPFYKAVSVIDFVIENLNIFNNTKSLDNDQLNRVESLLKGIRVEADHKKDSVRRITGITPSPMSEMRFTRGDQGKQVSVVDYFRDRYTYTLRYVNWPCLQVGSDRRPTYLPMEVCKIVEGQRYAGKLQSNHFNTDSNM